MHHFRYISYTTVALIVLFCLNIGDTTSVGWLTLRMLPISPCIGDSADAPSISLYQRQRGCSQYLHVSETAQMLPVSTCIGDSADVPSISLYWRQRGCSQYLTVSETARMLPVSPCIGGSVDASIISMYRRQCGCSQYSISLYRRQRGCRTCLQMNSYIFKKFRKKIRKQFVFNICFG